MDFNVSVEESKDRRVRRSRAALMRAAIALVTERETASIPVTDIAEAADVGRPVLYSQYGDRDTLLLEAATDLLRRELLPQIRDGAPAFTGRARALATATHFAQHRRFYRALLTSSCAFGLNKALAALLLPVNRQLVEQSYGRDLDPLVVEDVATYHVGGGTAFLTSWLVEAPDPLVPEQLTDRIEAIHAAIGSQAHRHQGRP